MSISPCSSVLASLNNQRLRSPNIVFLTLARTIVRPPASIGPSLSSFFPLAFGHSTGLHTAHILLNTPPASVKDLGLDDSRT